MTDILQKKEWKDFCLDNLFEIISTSSGIDKCRLTNMDGDIPYITRTDRNNGYELFIGKQISKYKIDASNVITIGLDTQTVFYQPMYFYTGQNIQILKSDHINKYTALFIIPMIKILMKKFNWGGNGATLTRLRRSKILLPVDSSGEPDYNFMENYVKKQEQELRKVYRTYLESLPTGVSFCFDEKKKWKDFYIKDLVVLEKNKSKPQVPTGANISKALLKEGKIPRITVTAFNNGIDNFYAEAPELTREYSNFISVSFLGGAYYHPYTATTDMKVHTFKLKEKNLNRYVGLFIITALKNNTKNTSYGSQLSSTDLPLKRVLLPVTAEGKPDYVYMEGCMRYLEREKLRSYLDYLEQL